MFGEILTVYKYLVRQRHQERSARELCHTAHVQSGVNPQQTLQNKETTKPHHAGAPKTIIKKCITVEC